MKRRTTTRSTNETAGRSGGLRQHSPGSRPRRTPRPLGPTGLQSAGHSGLAAAEMRPLGSSVAGSVATVALLVGVLIAASHPVATATLLVAGVGGYLVARTLGPLLRTAGLPIPGTDVRLRVSTERGRARNSGERISRAFTVALVEERCS